MRGVNPASLSADDWGVGDDTPDLVAVLLARVRDAARFSAVDQRAWALVRTAAALRKSRSCIEAISVLEDAVELRPSWEVERAALTCAISTHCDAGDPLLAVKIGQSAKTRGADAMLLRALGRAHAAAFTLTSEPGYRIEAEACFKEAESLEPEANAAAAEA